MTKRVTIYARVSTQEQHSDTQVNQLRSYAKDRNLSIVNTYEEKISATKAERPQLQKLLDDVRKRQTDVVLVWKLDRLARSTRELLNRLEEFRTLGVELLSYTENIDTTTPAGKALFSMVAVFAEFENDIRSERIRAGMANAKQKGKHLGRPPTPETTIKRIKQMAKMGLPDSHIMRETGVSRNTLKKYVSTKRNII